MDWGGVESAVADVFREFGGLAGGSRRWCAGLAAFAGRGRMRGSFSVRTIIHRSRSEYAHMRISFLAWLAVRDRGPPLSERVILLCRSAGKVRSGRNIGAAGLTG